MTDYIKREDAVETARLHRVNGYHLTINIADEIEKLPSADVAPVRHGHWVESFKVNAPPTLRSRWICSWCGNVQTYGATDYCPNCGARMDGETNETKTS